MKQKDIHYQAFSQKWFEKNQKCLLVLFNFIYKFFPSLFFKSKETDDFGKNKIIEVGNNHATCDVGLQFFKKSSLYETASKNPENNHRTRRIYKKLLKKIKQGKIKEELKLLPARRTVFFTDWNYSKMLYEAFKPIWWLAHYWDTLVANKFNPAWNLGFDVLEYNPDAGQGGANATTDGNIQRQAVNEIYTSIRGGAGTRIFNTTGSQFSMKLQSSATNNQFASNSIGIESYNTATLPDGATISDATVSIASAGKSNSLGSPNLHVSQGAAADPAQLAASDYQNRGFTSFGSIAYASYPADGNYAAISMNASGIAAVNKTGITILCHQLNWDIDNSFGGIWASNVNSGFDAYTSDNGSNKPKLVVTYTIAAAGGGNSLMPLMGCG